MSTVPNSEVESKSYSSFADLGAYKERLEQQAKEAPDQPPPSQSATPSVGYSTSQPRKLNNSYKEVTLIMYLIGVDIKNFQVREGDFMVKFNEYQEIEELRIIRELCRLRNAFLQNFTEINYAFQNTLKNISTLPEYIPSDAVQYLAEHNIELQKTVPNANDYQIAINREIKNRIAKVESYSYDWCEWQYIKALFIAPNGTTVEGIKEISHQYQGIRNQYPFGCYLNWNPHYLEGNILYTDQKFCRLLYEMNDSYFENPSLVRDVGDEMKRDINEFMENYHRILFAVDCENSDPIKLASFLLSLTPAQRERIIKVDLFDSDYTTPAWQTLDVTGITKQYNSEHFVVKRVLEKKSMVDTTLIIKTIKEFSKNNVDAVVLVSSDSDYWAFIKEFPEIDFLVLLEKKKASQAIMQILSENGYTYCILDDFCTADTYKIKTKTIISGIQNELESFCRFNLKELMERQINCSWLSMAENEKKNFYDNKIKNKIRLSVDRDGNVSVVIDE